VLAYVDLSPAPNTIIAEGVWEGRIAELPRGAGGFGYDPCFWLPALGMTAAELDPALKNRLSHRGLASSRLRRQLESLLQAGHDPVAPHGTHDREDGV
jgi:XTP/dITP diphosphohydrolase